jgi:hypothetical protein
VGKPYRQGHSVGHGSVPNIRLDNQSSYFWPHLGRNRYRLMCALFFLSPHRNYGILQKVNPKETETKRKKINFIVDFHNMLYAWGINT